MARTAASDRAWPSRRISPEGTEVVILCFEGPDRYSRAGGLGVRVTHLARTLAADFGFTTHLIFVGDPGLAGYEEDLDGRLRLYRWCQWISRYYPAGVYEGEMEKLYDFNETVPYHVTERIARPAVAAGRNLLVLSEEWHTAHALCELSDQLYGSGLRSHGLLVWNANNTMGFDRINWGRLGYIATITTVSRYMKHVMWGRGVNPLVIPNGIPEPDTRPVSARNAAVLRRAVEAAGGQVLLVKVGRFDPDKRWLMAIDAVAALKARGMAPRLVMRGGIEAHEQEVLGRAHGAGLRVMPVHSPPSTSPAELAQIIARHPEVDVFNLKFFVSEGLLRTLYRAADCVLANSGVEPFGLVGLEVMGAGGIPFTGATGEDYAIPFVNAIVLETDDPREIAYYVQLISRSPELAEQLREEAVRTAARFAWPRVVRQLLERLEYVADALGLQGYVVPAQPVHAGEVSEAAATFEEGTRGRWPKTSSSIR